MSTSVEEAVRQADWFLRFALDRLPDVQGQFHPGFAPHLKGAASQSGALVKLLDLRAQEIV